MHIFKNLETVSENMNLQDKVCVLLFDEISISPNLIYKKNSDYIEGFEDLGDGLRKPIIADHACVFMLRGLKTKWKQPIGFLFCQSTVKSHDLVVVLKKIINLVLKSGLELVGTVCDQASTNVSAINILRRETQEKCDRLNTEDSLVGFKLHG